MLKEPEVFRSWHRNLKGEARAACCCWMPFSEGNKQLRSDLTKPVSCCIKVWCYKTIIVVIIIILSHFLTLWKQAVIVPVLKKGESTLVSNYRPISLLSNFSKRFEFIIHIHISLYVKSKISPHQQGFSKTKYTKLASVLLSLHANKHELNWASSIIFR
jgi:hypothetical protein